MRLYVADADEVCRIVGWKSTLILGRSRRAFVKLVGSHTEDIALMALP